MSVSRRAFLLGSRATDARAVASVGESCLALAGVVCRNCGDACEARAVNFSYANAGVPRPVIDTERCTACGDCLPACPVGAIRIESGASA